MVRIHVRLLRVDHNGSEAAGCDRHSHRDRCSEYRHCHYAAQGTLQIKKQNISQRLLVLLPRTRCGHQLAAAGDRRMLHARTTAARLHRAQLPKVHPKTADCVA